MDPIIEEQLFHLYEFRMVRTMSFSLSGMDRDEFVVMGQVHYNKKWRFMILRGRIHEIVADHRGIDQVSAMIERTRPEGFDYGLGYRVGMSMVGCMGMMDGVKDNPGTTREFKFNRTLDRQKHTLGYIYKILHDHMEDKQTNIVLYNQLPKATKPEHFNVRYHARDADMTPIDAVSRRLESLFNTKND